MLRCLQDSVHFNSSERTVAASDLSWENKLARCKDNAGDKEEGSASFHPTYVAQLDGCGKFFVVFCSTFVISRNYLEEQFGFLEKRGI